MLHNFNLIWHDMRKIAVILLNMGAPDSLESVQPFLFNLFNDKAIINLRQPFRWLLAKFIAKRRTIFATEIYKQLGGKSPLLELTKQQASALERELMRNNQYSATADAKQQYRVFICMRYWHPMAAHVVEQVQNWQADQIILLPLYPQFSCTTTGSSFKNWQHHAIKQRLNTPTIYINHYNIHEDFINAHVELLQAAYIKAVNYGNPNILFSAHGLPQKVIDAGDPYQQQVEQSAHAIIAQLKNKLAIYDNGILKQQAIASSRQQIINHADSLNYTVCYQSKIGPMQWLRPSLDEAIIASCQNKQPVIVVPISFVSEHSETLVELDIEYRKFAQKYGCVFYERVPALGTNHNYIKALAKLCYEAK